MSRLVYLSALLLIPTLGILAAVQTPAALERLMLPEDWPAKQAALRRQCHSLLEMLDKKYAGRPESDWSLDDQEAAKLARWHLARLDRKNRR